MVHDKRPLKRRIVLHAMVSVVMCYYYSNKCVSFDSVCDQQARSFTALQRRDTANQVRTARSRARNPERLYGHVGGHAAHTGAQAAALQDARHVYFHPPAQRDMQRCVVTPTCPRTRSRKHDSFHLDSPAQCSGFAVSRHCSAVKLPACMRNRTSMIDLKMCHISVITTIQLITHYYRNHCVQRNSPLLDGHRSVARPEFDINDRPLRRRSRSLATFDRVSAKTTLK